MKHTKHSLELTEKISYEINNNTFHHHYHILYDIGQLYNSSDTITYVELGCYAGGSACLMLQRPNTNVISIDLGTPMPKDVVYENVRKLNIHANLYTYIQGDSQSDETYNKLISQIGTIDILFIDADHSYQGVINDFLRYHDLVKSGGYIIFDDYNDYMHCPEVKPAVTKLIEQHGKYYDVIGTLPNIYNARPAEYKDGNVFTIRKL